MDAINQFPAFDEINIERTKRAVTLWLGDDVIELLDSLHVKGWSRSLACDHILKTYFESLEEITDGN